MSKELDREQKDKADFYKKGFWICVVYVIWDTLRAFGWL